MRQSSPDTGVAPAVDRDGEVELSATSKRSRGVAYLSRDKLKAWQQAYAIAHERRSEAEALELMNRAATLALEQHQHLAKRAA